MPAHVADNSVKESSHKLQPNNRFQPKIFSIWIAPKSTDNIEEIFLFIVLQKIPIFK